jgi:hypothetical protein
MKLFFSFKWMRFPTLLLFSFVAIVGRSQVSVTFSEIEKESVKGIRCYNIVLEAQGSNPILLAGQNYRLYYNSDGVLMQENSIKSFLPANSYLPLKLVQHYFDMDASGFGVLPYENNLGFINIATDYNLTSSEPIVLKKGAPFNVAEICFDVKDDVSPQMTWAQDHLTHTYATAFVELAKLEDKILRPAPISSFNIVTKNITNTQVANVLDASVFPNPFSDKLTLQFNEPLPRDANVKVHDVFRNLVKVFTITKGSQELILDGKDLLNGAYILDVETNEQNSSKIKVIKIK